MSNTLCERQLGLSMPVACTWQALIGVLDWRRVLLDMLPCNDGTGDDVFWKI